MTIKFVAAWKHANGDPEEEGIDQKTKEARKIPATVREIGAAFDNVMPLLLAGAGAAIGPAGYAIAQAIPAEDGSGAPLYIARQVPPGNMFLPVVVPSMITACTTLSLAYISSLGTVPPTPEIAGAAWTATPAGLKEAEASLMSGLPAKFTKAMAQYLGTVASDGLGTEDDAPPPPAFPDPPPLKDAAFSGSLITYENDLPDLPSHSVRVTGHAAGTALVYAWTFADGDEILGAASGPTATFAFPFSGFFAVTLTVCNGGGTLKDTRADIFAN
jgi:hypothetical protein